MPLLVRYVSDFDPMLRTVSPPHAPYGFPYSLLFVLIEVCSNVLGGHTESQAPLSTVRKQGLSATMRFSPASLLFILMLFCFGFGTICEILFVCVRAGLTPSSMFRDAVENAKTYGSS